jgi:hypothetical protein
MSDEHEGGPERFEGTIEAVKIRPGARELDLRAAAGPALDQSGPDEL